MEEKRREKTRREKKQDKRRDKMKQKREDERENEEGLRRKKNNFFVKNVSEPSNPPDELAQNVSKKKKNFRTNYSSIFLRKLRI